jgi:hypothetical protein
MKVLLPVVLAVFLAGPVFAQYNNARDVGAAIDNKKADAAQKIQARIDKENQNYENRKNELQDKYKDQPDKLSQELDRLSIEHKKKLERLDNDLKMKEEKLDSKKNNP